MDKDFLINMGISVVLSAIKSAFKSEKAKNDLKKAMLKIRNQINALYAGDADFE